MDNANGSYEFEVREIEAQPFMSISVSTTPDEMVGVLGQILPEVFTFLERQGVMPTTPPTVRFHEFTDEQVDLEGGLTVAEAVQGEGRIQAGSLPGGTVVATWHVGSYDSMMPAHLAFEEWLQNSRKERNGGHWEVYWTDPGENPDPSTWRTEIIWPVK